MPRQNISKQFRESGETRYLRLIPISAVAQSEHETIVISAIECYSDRSLVLVHLQLGPGHPEHEWRRKGRGGFPHVVIDCMDDLDTEYAIMSGGGGGDEFTFNFRLQIIPAIPETATRLEISLFDVSWEGPHSYLENEKPEDTPPARWHVQVDLATQVAPREMIAIATE